MHREESKRLCLYIDANDSHCSGFLTQVPRVNLFLPYSHELHEPLAFFSGCPSGAKMVFSTLKKEVFAAFASIIRLSHLLLSCSDVFDLYTDHNNLISTF